MFNLKLLSSGKYKSKLTSDFGSECEEQLWNCISGTACESYERLKVIPDKLTTFELGAQELGLLNISVTILKLFKSQIRLLIIF